MDTLFDAVPVAGDSDRSEENEPGIRRVNREKLIAAYEAELAAHPPVASCAGDSSHGRATRRRIAEKDEKDEKDEKRAYRAAARLGCTVSLVSTAAPNPWGNLSTRRGGHA
jgi:hypothetical protein